MRGDKSFTRRLKMPRAAPVFVPTQEEQHHEVQVTKCSTSRGDMINPTIPTTMSSSSIIGPEASCNDKNRSRPREKRVKNPASTLTSDVRSSSKCNVFIGNSSSRSLKEMTFPSAVGGGGGGTVSSSEDTTVACLNEQLSSVTNPSLSSSSTCKKVSVTSGKEEHISAISPPSTMDSTTTSYCRASTPPKRGGTFHGGGSSRVLTSMCDGGGFQSPRLSTLQKLNETYGRVWITESSNNKTLMNGGPTSSTGKSMGNAFSRKQAARTYDMSSARNSTLANQQSQSSSTTLFPTMSLCDTSKIPDRRFASQRRLQYPVRTTFGKGTSGCRGCGYSSNENHAQPPAPFRGPCVREVPHRWKGEEDSISEEDAEDASLMNEWQRGLMISRSELPMYSSVL